MWHARAAIVIDKAKEETDSLKSGGTSKCANDVYKKMQAGVHFPYDIKLALAD